MVYHTLCNTGYRAIQQQNHWESAAAKPPSIYQTNNGNILLHEAQVGCPTNWLFYELMKVEHLLWHHLFRFIRTASDASAALWESFCSSYAVNYKQTTKSYEYFWSRFCIYLIRLGNLDESRKKHYTIRSIPVWYLKHTSLSPGQLGLNTPPSEETLQPQTVFLWFWSHRPGSDLPFTKQCADPEAETESSAHALGLWPSGWRSVNQGHLHRVAGWLFVWRQLACVSTRTLDCWFVPSIKHAQFSSVKLTFWCLLFESKVSRETFFWSCSIIQRYT